MHEKSFPHKISWIPDSPISSGAKAYHTAVIHASWHIDNIVPLIRLVTPNVRSGHLIVDFGAGTGSSAIFMQKYLPKQIHLLLVDNSASWLGHAYSLLSGKPNVGFALLKQDGRYVYLHEVVGQGSANHVVSANTIHLMSDLKATLEGVNKALKRGGTFNFQSGNILRKDRDHGILMIHNTVDRVHDLAIDIINANKKYASYQKNLPVRIKENVAQRKFVFPDPKSIDYYLGLLSTVGFRDIRVTQKSIRVKYADWLKFLRVRRLQAGILPEVGGKEATPREALDRNELITEASRALFKELQATNPHANRTSFLAEWVYVTAKK